MIRLRDETATADSPAFAEKMTTADWSAVAPDFRSEGG